MELNAWMPILVAIPIPVFVVAATFEAFTVSATVPHFHAFLPADAGLAALFAHALRICRLRKE